jgi:hypothetical protein
MSPSSKQRRLWVGSLKLLPATKLAGVHQLRRWAVWGWAVEDLDAVLDVDLDWHCHLFALEECSSYSKSKGGGFPPLLYCPYRLMLFTSVGMAGACTAGALGVAVAGVAFLLRLSCTIDIFSDSVKIAS